MDLRDPHNMGHSNNILLCPFEIIPNVFIFPKQVVIYKGKSITVIKRVK